MIDLLQDEVEEAEWITRKPSKLLQRRAYLQHYRGISRRIGNSTIDISEERLDRYRRDNTRTSTHRFYVQIFSGEDRDRTSADMLTSFGIDVDTRTLVVSQIIPHPDGARPVTDDRSLEIYDLYGILYMNEPERWQALEDAIDPE